MSSQLLNGVYWVGLIGALISVVVYFVQIAMRPKWVRLISGAGLFFTGVGLAHAATSLRALGPSSPQAIGAGIGVAALIAVVYFQSIAALRGRRAEAGSPARTA
jgi:hypothetical protein